MFLRILIAVLLTFLLPLTMLANVDNSRGPVRQRVTIDDWPNLQNWVLRAGAFAMNATNWGVLGNNNPGQDEAVWDPCPPSDWAPQCEYPQGSEQQYLYQAGLWLGALIVEDGFEVRRVSTALDGWLNPSTNELNPGAGDNGVMTVRSNETERYNCFGDPMYSEAARASEELIAVYSDTLDDPFWVNDDPIDGEHRPLGIEVQQSALDWSAEGFDRFALVDYRIRNIGSNFLKNLYIGFFVDADCGPAYGNGEAQDDICGFHAIDERNGDTINVAWIADNDGRRFSVNSGPLETPHIAGTLPLVLPGEQLQFSMNWWISNTDNRFDYGPAWQSHANNDSGGMGWTQIYGTPMGDEHKYQLLSNGENDFDQVMANQVEFVPPQVYRNPWTGETRVEPWSMSDPSPMAQDIANGYDTRYLLSWGPVGIFDYVDGSGQRIYRLNPGEEVTLTLAYLLGDYFHDPSHPQPSNQTIDSSLFVFTGLEESAERAKLIFETQYAFQPPAPPGNVHPEITESGQVRLEWSIPSAGTIGGYNIFGIGEGGAGEQVQFNSNLVQATGFTITGLTGGDDWLFKVVAVDTAGNNSLAADTLVRVSAPLPVTGLSGVQENGDVWLHWIANEETNVDHYVVHRTGPDEDDSTAWSSESVRYVDATGHTGDTYYYRVSAVSAGGIASLLPAGLSFTVYRPQGRILVIDETDEANQADLVRGGVNDDSVSAWYRTLLSDLGEPFNYIEQVSGLPLVFTLNELALYDIVIWHSEDNRVVPFYDFVLEREQLFQDYVAMGGRMLRVGRFMLAGSLLAMGCPTDLQDGFLSPCEFESVCVANRWSPTVPGMQFIGAIPYMNNPYIPPITLDTAKVHALRFMNRHLDYLPEIDLFWPFDPMSGTYTSALYTSVIADSDTAVWRDGQPCAVMAPGMIVLGFPFYFLDSPSAHSLLQFCLSTLRFMDTEPPRISLGVVQNPIATAELDLYLVADEALFNPVTVVVRDGGEVTPMTFAETVDGSNVYHHSYTLTTSSVITLFTSVWSAGGQSDSVEHTFVSHYASPRGDAFEIAMPDGSARIAFAANAFASGMFLILESEAEENSDARVNILSRMIRIGPADVNLEAAAEVSIRCDATPEALVGKSLYAARRSGSQWAALAVPVRISGDRAFFSIDKLGTYAVFEGSPPIAIPGSLELHPGYPNPFNSSTAFRFALPHDGRAQLGIYNVLGQLVRVLFDEERSAGIHDVSWDGRDDRGMTLGSGVYFARLTSAGEFRIAKVALLR